MSDEDQAVSDEEAMFWLDKKMVFESELRLILALVESERDLLDREIDRHIHRGEEYYGAIEEWVKYDIIAKKLQEVLDSRTTRTTEEA